jgi:hypothetical protein
MRLQKYSNPHLVVDTTRIVSRRSLQLEDRGGDDAAECGESGEVTLAREEVDDLHAELNRIVSKQLKLKRTIAHPDESHSRKRRKTSVGDGETKLVEPQQHSEPVREFTSSRSLQGSY